MQSNGVERGASVRKRTDGFVCLLGQTSELELSKFISFAAIWFASKRSPALIRW